MALNQMDQLSHSYQTVFKVFQISNKTLALEIVTDVGELPKAT